MRDSTQGNCRVGLVHDWFPGMAGGEFVTAELARCFPSAPIYTLFDFLDDKQRAIATNSGESELIVSGLNNLPMVNKYYRYLMLPCTRAVEKWDLRGYDCVISSSAAYAKGVITGVDQPHIAYIHSPPRYAWDLQHEYLDGLGNGMMGAAKRMIAHRLLHRMRMWDLRTINMIDTLVANSEFIARRINKIYRRDAIVVNPPINCDRFSLGTAPVEGHFVTASRLVSYKRIDLIVRAFAERPDLCLRVIGDGPEMTRLKSVATPNVQFLGHLPQDDVIYEFQTARAFLFAALEDFGMVPVEAQACGTPVIAFGEGGAVETVVDVHEANPTGVLFDAQTVPSVLEGLDRFIEAENTFDREVIRQHAETFDTKVFHSKMKEVVEKTLETYHS